MSNAEPHMSFHTNLHSCGITLFILQSRSAFMWTAVKSQPIGFQWENNGYSLRATNRMQGAFWLAIKVQMQLIFQTINIHLETTTKCQSKVQIKSKSSCQKILHLCYKAIFPSIWTYNKQHLWCLSDRQNKTHHSSSLTVNENQPINWNWALA